MAIAKVIAAKNKELARLTAELAEAKRERDQLQQWVHDLQAGMYINCVYCGHRYGPDDEVPATMAQALKEHVEQCPKHPMSALKADNARLQEALQKLLAELSEVQVEAWVLKVRIDEKTSARVAGYGVCGHGPLCTRERCRRFPRMERKNLSLAEQERLAVHIERVARQQNKHGIVMVKRSAGRGVATPWLIIMTEGVWRDLNGPLPTEPCPSVTD